MNEKILPDDIESKSLSELTDIADRLIQELESKKNLEESIDDYQYLIKLNNLIEKKFQKDSKNISESTKLKIEELTSKYEKIYNNQVNIAPPKAICEKLIAPSKTSLSPPIDIKIYFGNKTKITDVIDLLHLQNQYHKMYIKTHPNNQIK